jgi:hypothetical protein
VGCSFPRCVWMRFVLGLTSFTLCTLFSYNKMMHNSYACSRKKIYNFVIKAFDPYKIYILYIYYSCRIGPILSRYCRFMIFLRVTLRLSTYAYLTVSICVSIVILKNRHTSKTVCKVKCEEYFLVFCNLTVYSSILKYKLRKQFQNQIRSLTKD